MNFEFVFTAHQDCSEQDGEDSSENEEDDTEEDEEEEEEEETDEEGEEDMCLPLMDGKEEVSLPGFGRMQVKNKTLTCKV